jgi:hypothetical protein
MDYGTNLSCAPKILPAVGKSLVFIKKECCDLLKIDVTVRLSWCYALDVILSNCVKTWFLQKENNTYQRRCPRAQGAHIESVLRGHEDHYVK